MSEQELLRTALVLPPRARRVLCVWAAVPGLVCAPFAFWQSVWAGVVFCAVWAALVALVRARCCSFVAALTADSVTVQAGVAIPVLHRIPRRAVTGVQLLRTPLLWAAGCTVLLVRSPGLQLVLPGIPAAQATALAAAGFQPYQRQQHPQDLFCTGRAYFALWLCGAAQGRGTRSGRGRRRQHRKHGKRGCCRHHRTGS